MAQPDGDSRSSVSPQLSQAQSRPPGTAGSNQPVHLFRRRPRASSTPCSAHIASRAALACTRCSAPFLTTPHAHASMHTSGVPECMGLHQASVCPCPGSPCSGGPHGV